MGGRPAQRPAPPRRKRAFAPKTQTGCPTCRIRHVKCDEGKPFCLRCTSTGRQCEGFLAPPPLHETPNKNDFIITTSSDIARSLTVALPANKQELRSFKFLQQVAIPEICGFYDSGFWTEAILQACHHIPAIRHAAIALGSLYERFESEDSLILKPHSDIGAGAFALEQYNKAIWFLLQPPCHGRQPSGDVILITCLLFVCFEAMRGHIGSTVAHIDSGIKILSELRDQSDGCSSHENGPRISELPIVPISTLNTLFTRLDLQVSHINSRPWDLLGNAEAVDLDLFANLNFAVKFCDLAEARDSQDCIKSHWIQIFKVGTPFEEHLPPRGRLEVLRKEYAEHVRRWGAAFSSLLRSLSQGQLDNNAQFINMLKIDQTYQSVNADVDLYRAAVDETIWDAYLPQFEEILILSESILSRGSFFKKPVFALENGIIAIIYWVASRCRHPEVRREAISCLSKMKCQEGVWNSETAGEVAQRIVQIEELAMVPRADGTGDWIPGYARVHAVKPQLHLEERRGVIWYQMERKTMENRLVYDFSQSIEW